MRKLDVGLDAKKGKGNAEGNGGTGLANKLVNKHPMEDNIDIERCEKDTGDKPKKSEEPKKPKEDYKDEDYPYYLESIYNM